MDKKHKKLLTPDEARLELRRCGTTVRAWAKKHEVSSKVVFELLGGRIKGNYGQAHRAAVLLGLKDGVVE